MPRGQHFTPEFQRAARAKVKHESLVASGRRGAQATIAKYGYEVMFQKCRRYRLNNPSRPERQMMQLLADLGIEFEREWRIGDSHYTVDFKFCNQPKIIEVHGAVHQNLDVARRVKRDGIKQGLLAAAGIEWLYVTDVELRDVDGIREKVACFAQIALAPDPDCQWCKGKGRYEDSYGEEPYVKYEWVECECQWRHLTARERKGGGE